MCVSLDVWMCVSKLFSTYYSYSFSPILTKLGTLDLCANMQTTVEQVFRILILKVLAIFFKFHIWTSSLKPQQWSSLGRQLYVMSINVCYGY